MRLTARALNRATLARQLLLRREPLSVADGVRRIVALQAQDPASPYIAMWNRLIGLDPAEVDRAFADGSVVKAHLMRITLHAVHASDYPAFHEAMQTTLRAARLNDRRFRASGLTVAEADALAGDLMAYARTRRADGEIGTWIDERLGERAHPRVWWAIRHYAPLHHAPTGGPWAFRPDKAYIAASEPDDGEARRAGVHRLVQRYLEAFGPASARDVAAFSLIRANAIHDALRSLRDDGIVIAVEGPDGHKLFDLPGGLLPDADSPAPPRLLGMWDSVLLAYADRSRVIPPEHRRLVIRSNGDVLPTLLVDGYVAGVWRPLDGGIEATAFHPLSDAAWAGLESEARGLVAFLGRREPHVYRRYAHWWSTLPSSDIRVLGR